MNFIRPLEIQFIFFFFFFTCIVKVCIICYNAVLQLFLEAEQYMQLVTAFLIPKQQ